MLVLTRKVGEGIHIGSQIVVTIVRVNGGQVRLGIEAPREVPIYRSEIADLGWRDEPTAAGSAAPVAPAARGD